MLSLVQRFLTLILALGFLAISGCAQTAPTRFYLLSYGLEEQAQTPTTTAREGISIGVGPVEFPRYLDRSDIVTRSSRNKLELAEFDRWAGDLGDSFTRALAENLSSLLETDRISVYPWSRSVPLDYQITIQITAFETSKTGENLLDARWAIFEAGGGQVLLMARSRLRQVTYPTGPEDDGTDKYEAIARAMSRNVLALSRDIAERIRSISQQ